MTTLDPAYPNDEAQPLGRPGDATFPMDIDWHRCTDLQPHKRHVWRYEGTEFACDGGAE